MDNEERIKELEKKVKKLENVLFSIDNDPRFKAKVRNQIFHGEHAAGKPTIVNANGKAYNVNIV